MPRKRVGQISLTQILTAFRGFVRILGCQGAFGDDQPVHLKLLLEELPGISGSDLSKRISWVFLNFLVFLKKTFV